MPSPAQLKRARLRLPPCPVCGDLPQVEKCEPWPRGHGRPPWYVGCYKRGNGANAEHCVAVNGNNQPEAFAKWRAAVLDYKQQAFMGRRSHG